MSHRVVIFILTLTLICCVPKVQSFECYKCKSTHNTKCLFDPKNLDVIKCPKYNLCATFTLTGECLFGCVSFKRSINCFFRYTGNGIYTVERDCAERFDWSKVCGLQQNYGVYNPSAEEYSIAYKTCATDKCNFASGGTTLTNSAALVLSLIIFVFVQRMVNG